MFSERQSSTQLRSCHPEHRIMFSDTPTQEDHLQDIYVQLKVATGQVFSEHPRSMLLHLCMAEGQHST